MGPRMLLKHKEKRLRIMSVGCGDMPVYLHEKRGGQNLISSQC